MALTQSQTPFEVASAYLSNTLDSSPQCLEEKPILLRKTEAKTHLHIGLTDFSEEQLSFECLGLHNFPKRTLITYLN